MSRSCNAGPSTKYPASIRPVGWLQVTGLGRAAVDSTHDFYRFGLGRDDICVSMLVMPQRFGDEVNLHIHVHALATCSTWKR